MRASKKTRSKVSICNDETTVIARSSPRESPPDANSTSATNKRGFNYGEGKTSGIGASNLNKNFAPRSRLLITGFRSESKESLAVSHSPAKTVIPNRVVEAIRGDQFNRTPRNTSSSTGCTIGEKPKG